MNKYLNTKRCAECGGKCCKGMPGICEPKDFGNSFDSVCEGVRDAIESGNYAIDCWEDDINTYYVRPATEKCRGAVVDYSWGGACVFLHDTGCELKFKDRPKACRDLIPSVTHTCKGVDKLKCAKWWKDYQTFLIKLIEESIHNRIEESASVAE